METLPRRRKHYLLLISFMLGMVNTLGFTLSNALFLSVAGIEHLPFAYLIMGISSVPVCALISRWIDRYVKARLGGWLLLASGLFALLCWFLAKDAQLPFAYLVIIGYSFQWIIQIYIFQPSLISDYATVLEYRRWTVMLTFSLGLGGIFGGGFAGFLPGFIGTANVFLLVAALSFVTAYLLIWVANHVEPLAMQHHEDDIPSGQSAREQYGQFLHLLQRYPLVRYLGASVLCSVIVYAIAEYLYFGIYERYFENVDQLTSFLGWVRMAGDMGQLLLLWGVTHPLLKKWSIVRLNLIYPLSSFLAFASMAFMAGMPAALLLNVNTGTVEATLSQPIYHLNFNAIPQRFIGRVRAMCDGLIYAIALALSGIILWVGQLLAPSMMVWMGIAVSLIFLWIRRRVGQHYASSLLGMMQFHALELKVCQDSLQKLVQEGKIQLSSLLLSKEREVFKLGIHLLANMPDWRPYASPLLHALTTHGKMLLPTLVSAMLEKEGSKKIGLGSFCPATIAQRQAQQWLLAATRSAPLEQDLLLAVPIQLDQEKAIWIAWALLARRELQKMETLLVWLPLDCLIDLCQVMLQVEKWHNPDFLQNRKLMNALLASPEPALRIAGLHLIMTVGYADKVKVISLCLNDAAPAVRKKAILAARQYSQGMLASLQYKPLEVMPSPAWIEWLSSEPSAEAKDILWSRLDALLDHLAQTQDWLQAIPQHQQYLPFRLVLENFQQYTITLFWARLVGLGYREQVYQARTQLLSHDPRVHAEAVEALHTLPVRDKFMHVMPLLEHTTGTIYELTPTPVAITDDQWADSVYNEILRSACASPDPFIRKIAQGVHEMDGIVLLKQVEIFSDLSFQDLIMLDKQLKSCSYIQGEYILKQGEAAENLFIVQSGRVWVVKKSGETVQLLATLGEGQVVGEMGLFDGQPRSADVIAAVDCQLLQLRRSRFDSLLEQRPSIALSLCRVLSLRLRETSQAVSVQAASVK